MNTEDAKEIVEREFLAKNSDCALVEGSTSEHPGCFVFFYQSKKHVESGNFRDMLVGHGPIIICKSTGNVFETGSGYPPEHYIEAFEACGDPFGERSNRVEITSWNAGFNKLQATRLVKNVSGLGLSKAKRIIDSALLEEMPRFVADSPQSAEKSVKRLSEHGFNAKQLWSNEH